MYLEYTFGVFYVVQLRHRLFFGPVTPIVNQSSQETFWKAIFMIEFEPNEPGNLCGRGTAIIANAFKLKTEHGKGRRVTS
jgi:hypothetical protein